MTSIAASSRGKGSSGPLLAWAISLLVTGACVGSGVGIPDAAGNSGEVPQSFQDIQLLIFDPMCALQCHKGGAAPKGLSLEAGRAAAAMVGVPSTEVPALLRVAPGDPDQSYLIIKVVQFDGRRVGARMPRNGPPYLSLEQIRALRRWITAGGADDWVDSDDMIDAGDDDDFDAGIVDAAPLFDAVPSYDAVPIPDGSVPDAP